MPYVHRGAKKPAHFGSTLRYLNLRNIDPNVVRCAPRNVLSSENQVSRFYEVGNTSSPAKKN